jgi:hypothetical protein
MSRGPGRVERHVLDRLAGGADPLLAGWFAECGYVSIYTLAASLRGNAPTRSELVSVRRAVSKLGHRGEIEVRGRRNRMARLPVSEFQRECEEHEIARRRREHSAALVSVA